MNLNDLYAFIPEDMQGTMAVSADAVSITQDGAPFVLHRSAPADAADLSIQPVKPSAARPADAPIPQAAAPIPSPPATPEPAAEPKLSFFQRITNFFTRS